MRKNKYGSKCLKLPKSSRNAKKNFALSKSANTFSLCQSKATLPTTLFFVMLFSSWVTAIWNRGFVLCKKFFFKRHYNWHCFFLAWRNLDRCSKMHRTWTRQGRTNTRSMSRDTRLLFTRSPRGSVWVRLFIRSRYSVVLYTWWNLGPLSCLRRRYQVINFCQHYS